MKKLSLALCAVAFLLLGITGIVRAEVVLFEDFEDSSGFTIGGGNVAGYWGIAPLAGTDSIPSNFIQGGSQSGSIFYGSFAKEYIGSPAALMTISLPDLTGYKNLQLHVALAAPDDIWEPTHRDSLHIIGATGFSFVQEVRCDILAGCMPISGAIDSFLPTTYPDSLLSTVHSIGLDHQFQDFEYTIDSSLTSLTFAFASTDYPEIIGIDSVTITGDPIVIPVSIDIKPGSFPNSINLKSNGVVPVAILTTPEFDASTVDPTTVRFADAPPVKRTMDDVDFDGDLDMALHFNTQELNLDANSIEATLTGMTDEGIEIVGTDSVNIVPKGKK